MQTNYRYTIGIDPGTHTGVAVWNNATKELMSVETMKIHEAIEMLMVLRGKAQFDVVIEDPNTWVPFKSNADARVKAQGAGSVKRDFAIWRDFCNDYQIPMRKVRLQGTLKKMEAKYFHKLTGYVGKTSQHGRDAAMLVFKG